MKYRICDNGVYRNMTPEEIKELESYQEEVVEQEPTKEKLLQQLAELQEKISKL